MRRLGTPARFTAPPPIHPSPAPTLAIPRARWPLWAGAVAKFRREGDIGVGDTIVHLIGDERSEKFKKWFHRKFGKSCGCSNRQAWLNRRFQYL